jgi:HlyD family secretion protein
MTIARTIAVLALCVSLAACAEQPDTGYQGWVEADLIFVSPDEAGRVVRLSVREGDSIESGAPLYGLDDDLQKADLNQQAASLANAKQTFDRAQALMKTGSGTQASFDSAMSAMRIAEARVNTSQTRLARRTANAPVGGTVHQIYFREGEMVQQQRPVLSLLPPGNMKVRFFVSETELPKVSIGQDVRVSCDGCVSDLSAKVYYIATTAEYTPPVIYSQEERHKLVYLVQARPNKPDLLRVGQPVSVATDVANPAVAKK